MMFDIFKMVHFNPQITGAFYPQIDSGKDPYAVLPKMIYPTKESV